MIHIFIPKYTEGHMFVSEHHEYSNRYIESCFSDSVFADFITLTEKSLEFVKHHFTNIPIYGLNQNEHTWFGDHAKYIAHELFGAILNGDISFIKLKPTQTHYDSI